MDSLVILTIKIVRKLDFISTNSLSPIEAIKKEVCNISNINPNKVFARIKDKGAMMHIRAGIPIELEFVFIALKLNEIINWTENCKQYLNNKTKYTNVNNSFELIEEPVLSEVMLPSFDKDSKEICLTFLTPLKISPSKGKWAGYIDNNQFVKILLDSVFSHFNIKNDIIIDKNKFKVIPYFWNQTSIKHNSKSSIGNNQWIKGFMGPLYIKGDLQEILPYIKLCSSINLGRQVSNSQGYFKIEDTIKPFFDKQINITELSKAINEVINKYDWINDDDRFITNYINTRSYAEKLLKIINEQNKFEKNNAFEIVNSNGKKRIIEKQSPDQIIISYFLHKILQPYIERILEDESVGYRVGISIDNAIKKIEEAIHDGYEYYFESDIEDFFPRINIERLKNILDSFLPEGDIVLRSVIFNIIDTGFILNAREYERNQGIAQGAVLSPLLANLYLDEFDEIIKQEDVRLIRFADDFIILTKTKEVASNIQEIVTQTLGQFSLTLKANKTSINSVSNGFKFLGVQFTSEGPTKVNEEVLRLRKKPLYITKPFSYLKINGEAISILCEKRLVDTIPIRYIETIIITEHSTISTNLIKKCTENNIPIIITHYGYYINSIKPDNKHSYEKLLKHYQTFERLNDSQKLLFAKEIASSKIINYQTMFRQRYSKLDKNFHHLLEHYIDKMSKAQSVDQIRGIEGAASKIIYQKINSLIKNDKFKMKIRDRFSCDPMNSLINYSSFLLFTKINAEIRSYNLNPYLGFLHSPNDRYESLTADIQELFRCFVSRLIIKVVNLGIITDEDFELNSKNRLFFKPLARKKFIDQFERMMLQEIKGKSVKDLINRQIFILKEWAIEEKHPEFFKWK